ncbi:hypothetical protein [Nonomuraea salmonea]|uniref:hypothetical protein n=1 Tax=Nonomuraea salmonea TaxID=46181 RepID=UPI0031EDBE58
MNAVEAAASAAGPTEQGARLLGLAAAARRHHQLAAWPAEQEDVGRTAARAREALGGRRRTRRRTRRGRRTSWKTHSPC